MEFFTAEDVASMGFGPSYTTIDRYGRILPAGSTIAADQQGRQASPFSGIGQVQQMTEEGAPIGINPWPRHSVYRDSMKGMGIITQNDRFAKAAKWGAAVVDLDRRPVAMSGIMDVVKSYALPVGLGIGAAVVLAIVLKMRKKR